MEEERKATQSEQVDTSAPQENSQETSQNELTPPVSVKENKLEDLCTSINISSFVVSLMLGYSLQAVAAKSETYSSLLPKALSAVLHSNPGLQSDLQPSRQPAKCISSNLEQLQTELRDLRDQFEQMKSQHK